MTGRHGDIGRALFTDYLGLQDELTEQELDYLERTRRFVDHEVLPVIGEFWEKAQFPFELIPKMAAVGIVGDGIKGYGCPPMSPVAAGRCTALTLIAFACSAPLIGVCPRRLSACNLTSNSASANGLVM